MLVVCQSRGGLLLQRIGLGLEAGELASPRLRHAGEFVGDGSGVCEHTRQQVHHGPGNFARLPLPGTQVRALDHRPDLPQFAGGVMLAPGYVLHRPDIARCRVESQGRHRASVVVAHPPWLAARASIWSVLP